MGIQTMGFQGSDQQSHLVALARQNSWYNLTLREVENHLRDLGKPLGSINLGELLKNVWTGEDNFTNGGTSIDNPSPASSLQRQASLMLVRSVSGMTLDEVWRDIKQGQNIASVEQPLREMTLEDFLVKAGLFVAEASLGPAMGLSPSTSIDALSDTPTPGRKRGAGDAYEKTLEKRLRRKIKNRESAVRSRARKQAYHNELVNKVSHLEEENLKLRKEKELDMSYELCPEPRYQLRRTSSL